MELIRRKVSPSASGVEVEVVIVEADRVAVMFTASPSPS